MVFRIYYLDDEAALLEIFSEIFSSTTVQVKTFSEPSQLIAECKSNPPDLLFLDFRLPNTTGVAVAQQVDPKIPKVLVTGDLSVKVDVKFEAIFEKPIKVDVVEAFIKERATKK